MIDRASHAREEIFGAVRSLTAATIAEAEQATDAIIRIVNNASPSPSQVAPANPAQVTDATDEAVRLAGDILMSHGLNAPEQVIYRAAREILETAAIGAGGQAVAVKPLEWNPFHAETPFGYYHVDDQTDRSADELRGRPPFLLSGSRIDLSRHSTLEAARAAAQADYERRILSALSQPHPTDERVVEALEPFATFAESAVEKTDAGWQWANFGNDRICDWFGPSDFGAALSATEGR